MLLVFQSTAFTINRYDLIVQGKLNEGLKAKKFEIFPLFLFWYNLTNFIHPKSCYVINQIVSSGKLTFNHHSLNSENETNFT